MFLVDERNDLLLCQYTKYFNLLQFNRKMIKITKHKKIIMPLSLQNQNNLNYNNNPLAKSLITKEFSNNVCLKNQKLKIRTKAQVLDSDSHQKASNKYQTINTQMSSQLDRIKTENNQRLEYNCQNYYLRKIIFILYRYFEKNDIGWDLYRLNYKQLLIILKEMKYIRSSDQDSYQSLKSLGLAQLKQCYWLWNNIRTDKHFNLINLVILLLCVQNLQFDIALIQDVINQLIKGISKFTLVNPSGEPKYIFLVKKEGFVVQNGFMKLNKNEKERIKAELKSFKYNKWMENAPKVELEEIEQVQKVLLSKKSSMLAINKRQKILQQIRQKEPQIQNIELYHLLNYKESGCKAKPLKTQVYEPYNGNKNTEPSLISQNKSQSHHSQKKQESFMKKSKILQASGLPMAKDKSKKKEMPKPKTTKKLSIDIIEERDQKESKTKESLRCNLFEEYLCLQNQDYVYTQQKEAIIGGSDVCEEEQIKKRQSSDIFDEDLNQGSVSLDMLPLLIKPISNLQKDKQPKKRQFFEIPILYVDVNIQENKKQRIVIYDGDKAHDLAVEFIHKFGLGQDMVQRLQVMLQQQINSVLCKIQQALEEDCSYLY